MQQRSAEREAERFHLRTKVSPDFAWMLVFQQSSNCTKPFLHASCVVELGESSMAVSLQQQNSNSCALFAFLRKRTRRCLPYCGRSLHVP